MVTGQAGVIGVHAVSRVDQVYICVSEVVLTQRLYMAVMNV